MELSRISSSSFVLQDFKSDVIELCACFGHLQDLSICRCYALEYWPEKEFEVLVSLRRLRIEGCRGLTGYKQAPAKRSALSETRQLLPSLESLTIHSCTSLVEVFKLPASLRIIDIDFCVSLVEFRLFSELQPGHQVSSIYQGPSSPGSGAVYLEKIRLSRCHGLTGILHVPPSLKDVYISYCNGLTFLESCLGESPSLERLVLENCKTLSSLPDGPQAYSSLQDLTIRRCRGMKMLPTSLLQQLGGIPRENISARFHEDAPRPMSEHVICSDLHTQETDEEDDYSGCSSSEDKPSPLSLKQKAWKYVTCRHLDSEGTDEEEV